MAAAVNSSVPAASHRFPVVRRRQIVIAKDNGYSLKPQFHYYPQILRPCFLAPLSVNAGKSAAGIVNELKPNKRSSNKDRQLTVVSVATDDVDVIPHHGVNDSVDKQLVTSSASPSGGADREEEEEPDRIALESSSGGGGLVGDIAIDRAINAAIVLAAGTFAITKLLTIDRDYWHGWTIYEILRYAPEHNWIAYEQVLKTNPVLAKMMISGVVYSLGDWIAQCYEGKPLFDFDRTRMLRSGLVGFTLHGSLSHYYYYFCEALFPFNDWWVVPAKVLFDQTAWAALWNSIYYVVLGFLRFESPVNVLTELKTTFWPMLTAGWKLWPFAHVVTYGVIPVEQRLLWVDCVELVWVTILSTYSNEKSEARHSESPSEPNTSSLEKK